ncbi:single-stranded DNA-binding protein [Corynebacterium poyangense]|uniref:Single-stranded DNA-binding protein n=1 Tax=Corynebacterium poyangense TaxID=2684405 RepID=A0A7H0SQB3_9CORY|nr:single-stranded DNA-binding protein [Corynebacterium poyangense]QNQ90738.1 single-stranded DNA-binding protein [Corynebacterium poyangense]
MKNVNHITVTGNLTGQPEVFSTRNGTTGLHFTVAHNRNRKNDATGEWETINTTFWACTMWEKNPYDLQEQFTKGQFVIVSGRAELQTYTTKDGTPGAQAVIQADTLAAIPKTGQGSGSTPQAGPQPQGNGDPWGGVAQNTNPGDCPF